MKTVSLYLVLFCLISLSGCLTDDDFNIPCNTSDCITFNIKVTTDDESKTPIEGAEILLGWKSNSVIISNTERLARGFTDSNGEFSFKVTPDSSRLNRGRYFVEVFNGDEFFEQTQSFHTINSIDTTLNSNIHLPSKAILEIKYKNFNPTSDGDYFSVRPWFSTYGSNGIAVKQIPVNSGFGRNYYFSGDEEPFDEFVIRAETAGNQYTNFGILIKKEGKRLDSIDSLFISRGDTATFEIEFK